MKGQSEVFTFILLFLISLVLFITTFFWSKSIFQHNIDIAKVTSYENFIKKLDNNIKNLIKFGGYQEINYDIDALITLVNNKTIEIRKEDSFTGLPRYWVNISSDSSYIREILDGDTFRLQLIYPENNYRVSFFTEGPTLAEPSYIKIERNSTYIKNNKPTIKIKVTFM